MTSPNDKASILPANRTINGRSQAQLGDEWWKLIYAIPADKHFGLFDDRIDPRGRRGSVEKALEGKLDANTLFIGGGFGQLTTNVDSNGVLKIQRSIVLPNQGSATVFLPMLNASFDNLVNDLNDPNNLTGNLTGQQLQEKLSGLFNKSTNGGWVSSLFASVDGKPVTNPYRFRQASETPFSYTAPYPAEAGLLSSGGYTNATYLDNADADPIQLQDLAIGNSVEIGPAVSDGYWLAVDIQGGAHKLNFGGSLSDQGTTFFSLDISYDILNPVSGSPSRDILTGSPKNDFIDGGAGNDWLKGLAGDDLLLGGSGRDLLHGGQGKDELWGDAGQDLFMFRKGDGEDAIFDFSDGEFVRLYGFRTAAAISDVMLPSDVEAAKVDFGNGDRLIFVGLTSSDLLVQGNLISMA